MLEINVKDCKECGSIKELLCQVEDRIYAMSKSEYNNLSFLSKKNHTKYEIKRLIRYKNILNNLFWNTSYYDFDFKTIISRIKTLI